MAPPPARLDPNNPQRLQVEVDYGAGVGAPWYPRNQSPVLDPLVEEGVLPPVEERIGPEPIVYRGVEGIGEYGGTWVQPVFSPSDLNGAGIIPAMTLLRWSPEGYPVVPHVARDYDICPDYRTFTFFLRRGMRWSDGHPFTANDILYWWEDEVNNEAVGEAFPPIMSIGPHRGDVEKIDDYTVRFTFPKPNGLFLERLATAQGIPITGSPKHYLSQYHPDPEIGNADVIRQELESRGLNSPSSLYSRLKQEVMNVEHPRLEAWIVRTYRTTPPFTLVRNPYFCMVDEAGNQLPYVDQQQLVQVNRDLYSASISSGRFPFAIEKPGEITLLMNLALQDGYRAYRWFRPDRSDAMVHLNLNRRIEPGDPATRWKHHFLNDKRFRRALSVAINRADIIDVAYHGETVPAQVVPGP